MSLSTLLLKHCPLRNLRCSLLPFRPFSSGGTPISFTLSVEPEPEPEPEPETHSFPNPNDDLRSRIFRLRFPKRSATAALDKWVGEGKEVTQSELRQIAKDLKRSQRYKHALEISEWMKSHQEYELSDSDYAMRIDLITKVFGVNAAEEFFEGLPSAAKTCEVYTALLHAYAKAKLTEKAENLFKRIKESNFSPSALTYNEMMTLYMSVGQLQKVPEVVAELKRRKVSPDLFTYNLWISASAATLDVKGVRKILDEMAHDLNSDEGWKTYMKLADIYVTAGHLVNSDNSLVETEKKISQGVWITYDFLIILYSGLGNREGINEIWNSLKMTSQKMTSRNYVCVLSSYLVLGQLKEAGEVIDDWIQSKVLDFDVSACNHLLDAFVKAGLIEAAEAFQGLMLQRNCELSGSLGIQKPKYFSLMMQIMTWMESQVSFRVGAPDQATRLELITKVHSLSEAQAYFDGLSASASQKAAAFPLLHSYVKERDLEKAEGLMQRLLDSGLAVNPYIFNEMMKLYMATGQCEKVLAVIRHMKLSKIPLTSLSYSLWLNASGEVSGASSVEMVYKEMRNDNNVQVGWSTYATLATIYTKVGRFDKASAALKIAEEKLSLKDRLAYSFIMTSYAALKDRAGVLRVWESSRRVSTRITCANYMSVMLCFIKIGDIKMAERIFTEWESQCRHYDVRLSNVLLGAYMRNGWMDKAEAFHLHTLERGACPNYKTWEILMEGWVNKGQMDKAVGAMKKGFSKLKGCLWRPPLKIILAIAEYFELQGNVKDMRRYVKVLQGLGLMSLSLYKSALRAHIKAEVKALDILEMMERGKIELDEETQALIQRAKTPRNPDMKTNLIPCPTPLESFFAHYLR